MSAGDYDYRRDACRVGLSVSPALQQLALLRFPLDQC